MKKTSSVDFKAITPKREHVMSYRVDQYTGRLPSVSCKVEIEIEIDGQSYTGERHVKVPLKKSTK